MKHLIRLFIAFQLYNKCISDSWDDEASVKATVLLSHMHTDEIIAIIHGCQGDYTGNICTSRRLDISPLLMEVSFY